MSFETLSIITAVAASLPGLGWLSAGKSANGLLAILGIYEFMMRRVNASIFVSIAVELLLVIGFAGILVA